jgi:Fe-S-cluster containining protein
MDRPHPTVRLSRAYTCVDGAPTIDRVDPRIFTLTYFQNCLGCTFCHDSCCQYGADAEWPRVEALEPYRAELEAYTGVPAAGWFRTDEDDFGVLDEAEYPGGRYTRTQVAEVTPDRSPLNEWACVFLDRSPAGRGCLIHRFALERGIDVHAIKPMVCLLFPVSFADAALIPAYEFELDGELACEGRGDPLYRGARDDLRHYFGPDLVAELDALAAVHCPPPAGVVPLQVLSAEC